MNSRVRLGLEIVLLILIAAIGFFAFNQYKDLTNTQSTLSVVESNSTALAEQATADLSSAQSRASQSAAEANSTSTENSLIIAYNYGTETRVALVSNANQQRLYSTSTQAAENAAATSTQVADENSIAQANLVATSNQAAENAAAIGTQSAQNAAATGTQSAENAANRLNNANATGTQSADNASTSLGNANATGTQSAGEANAAADMASTQIAALNNEIENLADDLAESQDDVESQQDALDDADATIVAQQEEIDILRENGSGTSTDGFVLVETSRFEMSVFDDYIIVNYEDDDYQDSLDEISSMGSDYRDLANVLEDSASFLHLAGVRQNDSSDSVYEIMLITLQEGLFDIPLEDYLDTYSNNATSDEEILAQEVIELGGQDVGRVITTMGSRRNGFGQVTYVIKDRRTYWFIFFSTTIPNSEDRLADFDASVATFRLQ